MTDYDELKKRTFRDKNRGTSCVVGRIPSNAEIVHTETGGGSGPLYVWYREPEDDT